MITTKNEKNLWKYLNLSNFAFMVYKSKILKILHKTRLLYIKTCPFMRRKNIIDLSCSVI